MRVSLKEISYNSEPWDRREVSSALPLKHPLVTVSGLSETLSPCSLKKKREEKKRGFFCSWREAADSEAGPEMELGGVGTAAAHPPVLGLKNKENPTKPPSCKDSLLLDVGTKVQSDPPVPLASEMCLSIR